MQLFILESTVHAAARALCDRHVINQLGETAELLAIAHYRHEGKIPPLSRLKPRVRHRNHPCALWTAFSGKTYEWTYRYAVALCVEYTERFKRVHAYEHDILQWLSFAPFAILADARWTAWPQVMPAYLRIPDDPVTAYRRYYQLKSVTMSMRWSYRNAPQWHQPLPRRTTS